jgi:hypothetical protein
MWVDGQAVPPAYLPVRVGLPARLPVEEEFRHITAVVPGPDIPAEPLLGCQGRVGHRAGREVPLILLAADQAEADAAEVVPAQLVGLDLPQQDHEDHDEAPDHEHDGDRDEDINSADHGTPEVDAWA